MPTPEERRAYLRAHYHANKEMWRQKRVRYEAKILALIRSGKECPCADCGRTLPAVVLEYDHRPGTVKRFNLGGAARKHGEVAVRAEISKCDVLCPTCHRIRTFVRRGILPPGYCSFETGDVMKRD